MHDVGTDFVDTVSRLAECCPILYRSTINPAQALGLTPLARSLYVRRSQSDRLTGHRHAFVHAILEDYSYVMAMRPDRQEALVGHKVSHSNIKTKRRFLPNLRNVTLISDTLGRRVRLRVSANALKTVDHRGGLDAFLLKAKDDELSPRVLDLKRQIVKKRAAKAS